MTLIRFPNMDAKRQALGYLAGRFSFKSWASGEMAVPEAALAYLASENIPFSVEGQATYERLISAIRNPSAPAVPKVVGDIPGAGTTCTATAV